MLLGTLSLTACDITWDKDLNAWIEEQKEKHAEKEAERAKEEAEKEKKLRLLETPTAARVEGTDFVSVSAGSQPVDLDGGSVLMTPRPFEVCDHEVTQKEWCEVFTGDGENPSYYNGSSGKEVASDEEQELRPVETVNFYHAVAYCNKRSVMEGLPPCYSVLADDGTGAKREVDWKSLDFASIPITDNADWNAVACDFDKTGWRLPTCTEWEIAARAGHTGDLVASGTTDTAKIGDYAWYYENTKDTNDSQHTHQVKKKLPNDWGLYDMSGNVFEWCWNKNGYTAKDKQLRAIMGAGAADSAITIKIRVTRPHGWESYEQNTNIGFRVVRTRAE